MHKRVFQQISHKRGGKLAVDVAMEISFRRIFQRNFLIRINRPVIVYHPIDYAAERQILLRLRKLSAVNPREQQHRLVELLQITERIKHLRRRLHLLRAERLVFHKHLHPVDADGNRCLQFVRGIACELPLLLVNLLVTAHRPHRHIIQSCEFRYVGGIDKRPVSLAYLISVKPSDKHIERPHATVEHRHINHYRNDHHQCIQSNRPPHK